MGERLTFYHVDHLGTPRVITDPNGDVVSMHKYLPFGEGLTDPPSTNTHEFTGHERDAETGLDYMLARYYGNASTMRFLSVDPAFKPSKNLRDPQRWNRYTYSANNPLKYFDPDGQEYSNATGQQLRDKILSRSDQTTPRGSATGQKIVSAVQAEKEKVSVEVSSKAKFQLVDQKNNPVPGSQREVDPKDGASTAQALQGQAQAGEKVVPVGGEYAPTATDSNGNVTESTITIFAGSKDFSVEGQSQTEQEFVESEFVHESGHAEGDKPNTDEQQIKADQKKYEKESKGP